jgi:hypothetical protein
MSFVSFTMSILMGPEGSLEGKEIYFNLVALNISSGSGPERELRPARKTFSLEHAPSPLGIWPL